MAFPAVATAGQSEELAATTTHDAVMPASIANGDLLLAFVNYDIASTTTGWTGWTELKDGGANHECIVIYKIADGTEVDFTYTSSDSTTSATRVLRITGAHASQAPEAGTLATGTSTAGDPPSVTASWGSEDNLWFALVGINVDSNNGYPANYTLYQFTSDFGSESLNVAGREVAAATEDPGTFSSASSRGWGAQTVVVRPAAGAGTVVKDLIGGGIIPGPR